MTTPQYLEGYKVGRYKLDHVTIFHPSSDYLAGRADGRRHRTMGLVLEFSLIAIIVVCLAITGAALIAEAVSARMPV